MITVQLATPNWDQAELLANALIRDGEYEVRMVDQPNPSVAGLIVLEDVMLNHLTPIEPDRLVVIATRSDPAHLRALWELELHSVLYTGASAQTAYLAIIAAHVRLIADSPHAGDYPILTEGVNSLEDNGLRGPFVLTDNVIDQEVEQQAPGAFLLDDSADGPGFRVVYVGRSDMDVNNQLHLHVGMYKRFKFEYCPSPQAAFERECRLFHDFEPHDNPIHPSRPRGSNWTCPRCALLG